MTLDDTQRRRREISGLTSDQLAVLKLICDDNSYSVAAERLHTTKANIQQYMIRIYRHFHLDEIDDHKERGKILHERYCPLLQAIPVTFPPLLPQLPPPDPDYTSIEPSMSG